MLPVVWNLQKQTCVFVVYFNNGVLNLAEAIWRKLSNQRVENKSPKRDEARCCLSVSIIYLLQRRQVSLLSTVKETQTFIKSSAHMLKRAGMNVFTPAKVDWIAESHGLCVFNAMLKGSFHKGPWWGWDDGYGLSLGVNAAGLGATAGLRRYLLCHLSALGGHKSMTGSGAAHSGATKNDARCFGDKLGRS